MSRILFICAATALALQACATAGVQVTQAPVPTAVRFARVAIPPFQNGVGAALPAGAPEEVAGAIAARLQKEYPHAFADVTTTDKPQEDQIVVRGAIVAYDPGSKAARAILIGLGAGDLKLDVAIVDGRNGAVLEKFTTDGAIVAGGLVGASMGMEDMVASASAKVAERVATYGRPTQQGRAASPAMSAAAGRPAMLRAAPRG